MDIFTPYLQKREYGTAPIAMEWQPLASDGGIVPISSSPSPLEPHNMKQFVVCPGNVDNDLTYRSFVKQILDFTRPQPWIKPRTLIL